MTLKSISASAYIALALFSAAPLAYSQAPSKAETKLYTKTIAKATVAQYNKFLAKYPSSAYAEEVLTLRDSTLFAAVDHQDAAAVNEFYVAHADSPIKSEVKSLLDELTRCPISEAKALDLAKAAIAGYDESRMAAVAYRDINQDYVIVLDVLPSSADFRSMSVYTLACAEGRSDEQGSGNWEQREPRRLEKYSLDSSLDNSFIDSNLTMSEVAGRKMLEASYINSSSASNFNVEWCSVLFTPDASEQTNIMFYGRDLDKSAPAKGKYSIEGQSPETLSITGMSQETAYLLQKMNANDKLKAISKADAITDEALRWWLSKNPNAETTAKSVRPGTLDAESSLVQAFNAAKGKESSKSYNVAKMDLRGYTVIVSYSKSNKEYSLVWAEPVCVNKSRDKYIKTIYLDNDGTTLNLFYYKGNTSFKVKINLSSKSLTRQR